jgi:hypothetical protein
LKAAVRGANCVGCTHQHYLTAPKPKPVTNAVASAPTGEPAVGEDAIAV